MEYLNKSLNKYDHFYFSRNVYFAKIITNRSVSTRATTFAMILGALPVPAYENINVVRVASPAITHTQPNIVQINKYTRWKIASGWKCERIHRQIENVTNFDNFSSDCCYISMLSHIIESR